MKYSFSVRQPRVNHLPRHLQHLLRSDRLVDHRAQPFRRGFRRERETRMAPLAQLHPPGLTEKLSARSAGNESADVPLAEPFDELRSTSGPIC
jgi:hypothetical protein